MPGSSFSEKLPSASVIALALLFTTEHCPSMISSFVSASMSLPVTTPVLASGFTAGFVSSTGTSSTPASSSGSLVEGAGLGLLVEGAAARRASAARAAAWANASVMVPTTSDGKRPTRRIGWIPLSATRPGPGVTMR